MSSKEVLLSVKDQYPQSINKQSTKAITFPSRLKNKIFGRRSVTKKVIIIANFQNSNLVMNPIIKVSTKIVFSCKKIINLKKFFFLQNMTLILVTATGFEPATT